MRRKSVLALAALAVIIGLGTASVPAQAMPMATDYRVRELTHINTSDKVFFITVDDGYGHMEDAARYVRQHRLPVTTFLTSAAVGGDWDFFRRMSRYDSVQNHTMTHKALSLSSTDLDYEICYTQRYFRNHIGTRPWLIRPPYGAGWMSPYGRTDEIMKTAGACGITRVVLWNVVVDSNNATSFAGVPYSPGDIVLLHYNTNLKANLRSIIAAYAAHGLKPARLSEYLKAPDTQR